MSGKFKLTAVAAATTIALLPISSAWSAGFTISARSTSSLGNAFSGTAAQVEDASVVFNNPAGMQKLDGKHVSVALHTVFPDVKFSDEGSHIGGFPLGSGGDDTSGDTKYVPNFYYVQKLNPDARFGLGVYSPYGLGLEYQDNWTGRYFSTKSELKTVNVSPSFSFQASPKVSLGVSLDLQYIDAELTKQIDFGAMTGGLPGSTDGTNTLTGSNWSYGFSLGLLYDISEVTRFGAAFHSGIRQDINGKSKFSGQTGNNLIPPLPAIPDSSLFTNSDADVTLYLPETLSLSLAHDTSSKLTLMGDLTFTRWSRYDTLSVDFDNSLPTSTEEKNWDDVWRASIGANYRLNNQWLLRAGYAYEDGPVPNDTRDPRVPDGDRNWFTIGTNYKPADNFSLDLAYAYIHIPDVNSNLTDSMGHTLIGSYEDKTSYFSIQGNYQF
jgi:long-chain fatty acid transport protein